ncbi:MAG: hypothetical protein K2I52_05895 [Muribaculaceae bacterium]|nr:hypothetical protein [Muribaculaceae bacterium]
MANKPNPTIRFNHNLRYRQEYNEYIIQMKRKRRPWWLLLLLLPLLLLIRCERTITAHCFEPETGIPVENCDVTMNYQAHYLWNDGRFLATDSITRTVSTDDEGTAVFENCPCSVFSYIFYAFSKADFTAINRCHAAKDVECMFHYTWNVDLPMEPNRDDLHVQIVDAETRDPLPDASVVYRYIDNNEEKTDSAHADAMGIVTLPGMRVCGMVDAIEAGCYGYADTTVVNRACADLLIPTDSTAIPLRPIKQRFTFFVKDAETRQPIPDAICTVTLIRPSGTAEAPRIVHTSIDGKGVAAYDDAFVLSVINIDAKKRHYYDGSLEGGPWVVEKFIKQDDDTRTIWLRPEPYQVQFINVDSINGRPVPNVKNNITITDPAGNVETCVETSNSNGVFPVTAKEGSRIVIVSVCHPNYKEKTTVIDHFDEGEKIRMQPVMTDVNFKTVKDNARRPILPDCTLKVMGSISGGLQPSNSGSGEFKVTARINESLSIAASKRGYATNSTTVNQTPVANLQNRVTEIPLKEDPVVYNHTDAIQGTVKNCYDLHDAPSRFRFDWEVCDACTMLIVTDGNGNEIRRFGRNDPAGGGGGQQYTPPSGSVELTCSTEDVCVTSVNVNGHTCTYRISKLE